MSVVWTIVFRDELPPMTYASADGWEINDLDRTVEFVRGSEEQIQYPWSVIFALHTRYGTDR